jgi:hypothetical protein
MQYNAVIEVGAKPTKTNTERWLDLFSDHAPAISPTDDGNSEIVVPIDTLGAGAIAFDQASATALAISHMLGHVRSLTIMTTDEYDRRVDAIGGDNTFATTEAAAAVEARFGLAHSHLTPAATMTGAVTAADYDRKTAVKDLVDPSG